MMDLISPIRTPFQSEYNYLLLDERFKVYPEYVGIETVDGQKFCMGLNESQIAEALSLITPQDLVEFERSKIPEVTPRQFRQALVVSGHSIQEIETFLDGLEEPTKSLAKIEWEYSTAFIRSNQMLKDLAPMLGFTQESLDDLFYLAATL